MARSPDGSRSQLDPRHPGNPITRLANQADLKRVETRYGASVFFDEDGNERSFDKPYRQAKRQLNRIREAAEEREQDLSLQQAIETSPYWLSATPTEKRAMRHYVNSSIEQEYGGSWSDLSTWYFDDGDEFDGKDVLFPGGYSQVIDHLADGLSIQTGAVVTRIDPQDRGVSVTLQDGQTLSADRVIVTVPLGVLRAGKIAFGSELAPGKRAALEALKMGLLNKCWLRFDRVVWPEDVDWIEWMGPRDGYWSQWVSLAQSLKVPVLLAFHAGDQALEMEKLSDREMKAAAHEALKQLFGSSFPAPIDVQVTRWSKDPFSQGAYSFNAVGSSGKFRDDLAEADWDGQLYFAGEATSSDYAGTVHGAYLSGMAAAEKILAS